MEEIKIGEYVRTKDGIIAKLIETMVYELSNGKTIDFLEDIVKHSKQLIDLIEAGDFVNGEEVIEIRKINEKIYLMTDYCPQNYIKNDIKTILTKEQYENNCYKVGGKDETSND